MKSMRGHTSRNRFLESMIGWSVLTLTVCTLILLCSTISHQRRYKTIDTPRATVDKILDKEITFEMYKDFAVCANGAMYRKDVRGFLPELMEKMYGDRVIFKKRMLKAKQEYEKTKKPELIKEIARCNNIQMAKKISLNSAYGAIGNQYFRYYKLANAEAITLSGQVSIRWIEGRMNAYLNKILKLRERIMLLLLILILSTLIWVLLLTQYSKSERKLA